MPLVGLTRAGIISPIVAVLDRVGAPVEKLLKRANIPEWARTQAEMLIPTFNAVRLLAEGARTQGIENLGLLAGREARIESLGVFGRLIRRSQTVGEALRVVVRDHPMFSSSGRVWLRSRGEQVEFCQAFTNHFDKFDESWQQVNHYGLMLMLGIVRLGGGPTWSPPQVDVQTGESAAFRDADPLVGARLAFGQPATAITLPATLLRQRLPPPSADLPIPGDRDDTWTASAPARDFITSVVQAIEMLSWEGYPNIHLTADFLGMSVRTLQRHLAAAGVTHEMLVGKSRFATAAALLEETDTKILDIALDLGYSDHAHFTRAFRQWAGRSPQEYRRRRGATPGFAKLTGT
jgi:AraC-like DNA-binding protein